VGVTSESSATTDDARLLSVPALILLAPANFAKVSDAIDRRRADSGGRLFLTVGLADGGGMEILALVMLASLVSGSACFPFRLVDDDAVEADDKLCDAVRVFNLGDEVEANCAGFIVLDGDSGPEIAGASEPLLVHAGPGGLEACDSSLVCPDEAAGSMITQSKGRSEAY
jgi:hypothetical protein